MVVRVWCVFVVCVVRVVGAPRAGVVCWVVRVLVVRRTCTSGVVCLVSARVGCAENVHLIAFPAFGPDVEWVHKPGVYWVYGRGGAG